MPRVSFELGLIGEALNGIAVEVGNVPVPGYDVTTFGEQAQSAEPTLNPKSVATRDVERGTPSASNPRTLPRTEPSDPTQHTTDSSRKPIKTPRNPKFQTTKIQTKPRNPAAAPKSGVQNRFPFVGKTVF